MNRVFAQLLRSLPRHADLRIVNSHCTLVATHQSHILHISRSTQIKRMSDKSDVSRSGMGSLSDSSPRYCFVEEVEPLERYRPGGYHPVCLGDLLNERYRIVHKLGFGSYSTIWLAKDEVTSKWVAAKIVTADTSKAPESDLTRLLHDRNPRTGRRPGQEAIPRTLDSFIIRGPNGSHPCLVTTAARTSVADARETGYTRLYQPNVARSIAAQLVQAVAFLHSQGVVHADLHEGNILFRLPTWAANMTAEELYEKYGEPSLEPVVRIDGQPLDAHAPAYAVVPIWFGDRSETVDLSESGILLTDYGESFQPALTPRSYSHTPVILRPPELYFQKDRSLNLPSDIWALGCTIYHIMGQRTLFEAWLASDETIIQDFVEVLGRPPAEWWSLWAKRADVFNEDLSLKSGHPRLTLEDRFENSIQKARRQEKMTEMSEEEKGAFLELIRSMLAYKPEDRFTAEEILKSEWMIEWAMKDLEQYNRCREAV